MPIDSTRYTQNHRQNIFISSLHNLTIVQVVVVAGSSVRGECGGREPGYYAVVASSCRQYVLCTSPANTRGLTFDCPPGADSEQWRFWRVLRSGVSSIDTCVCAAITNVLHSYIQTYLSLERTGEQIGRARAVSVFRRAETSLPSLLNL